ncbi:MAG TPA: hypothetical protein PK867_16915, partial [Pirellulales bacterium]|nr:hypothetical protein [Pirellulales bacterium]
QLEAKYPDRACLLTTKALVLHSMERDDAALQAADRVLEKQPTNPVALAMRALVLMEGDDPLPALRPLHQALAACGLEVPQRVYETVGMVAETLLAHGYVMAALAHLRWQLQIKHDYEPALVLAYRIQTAPAVPLLFKDIRTRFDPAPAGVPYQAEFDAALARANEGNWFQAAEAFDALMFRAAGCAPLWRNLGRLRAYLADEARAAEALRRYASLDVPLDDAVEAEMLAQLLDPKTADATIEQVRIVYPVDDVDAVAARLSTSKLVLREPVETLQMENPDEPPPRALFTLLDRPMPESGSDLAEAEMPEMIGMLLVFGRQTDREPRVELLCEKPRAESAKSRLREIVAEALQKPPSEESAGRMPAPQYAMPGSWRVPADMPPERIVSLGSERRRRYLLEQWPRLPNLALGGRAPEQAASDRTARVAVLASIALWELNYGDSFEFNELRDRLGLPRSEAIDPATADLDTLPLARLHRLDAKKLSDAQLATSWRRAFLYRARLALVRLSSEAVARPSLPAADRAQAHGILASFVTTVEEAFSHLGQARGIAKSAGISCAGWDLEEMAIRLAQGQIDGFMELAQHIQTVHRNEPGVLERFARFLYEAGLVDEHGQPRRAPPAQQELMVPGGTVGATKIWTPEGEAGQGQKSTLWVPGS